MSNTLNAKNDLIERCRSYFGNGGLFNPEMMEHDKVRMLIGDLQAYLENTDSTAKLRELLVRWEFWEKESKISNVDNHKAVASTYYVCRTQLDDVIQSL